MLVVIGLIVAFVLVAIYARPSMRQCRWREDRRPGTPPWRCVACRASHEGPGPPRRCLRNYGAD